MRRKDFSKQILIFGSAMLMALPLAIPAASAQQLTPEKQQEVDALSQQIKSNPNDYLLYAKRGLINFKADKKSAARMDFEQALSINPRWQQGYVFRADHLKHEKNFPAALSACTHAINIAPYAPALQLRGEINWDLKKYDDAKKDFTEAIKINPECQPAYAGRAYVNLEQSGPSVQVMNDLQAAIRLNPSDTTAKGTLADVKSKLKLR